MEIVAGPDDQPAVVAAMEGEVGKLVGMKGSANINPRGEASDVSMQLPPGADASLSQQMDQLKQTMRQLCEVLPAEPVGVGAKWKVIMPVENEQLKMTQTANYTLSEVSGDNFKLDIAIEQTAPSQEMTIPGAGAAKLDSYTGVGSSSGQFSLASTVPTVTMQLKSNMKMSVRGQGSMTMDLDLNMDIAPKQGSE